MKIIEEERIGGQRLILGDCLQVMPLLGRFDAVVTDPPYGIKRDGQPLSLKRNGTAWRIAHEFKGWDAVTPAKELFDAIRANSENQIIWGGNYFSESLPSRRGWLIWYKGQQGLSMADAEQAWTSLEQPLRLVDMHRKHLWKDSPQHPTQKPVALMEWCLGFLPDARTILDPFMGSGTTLVACQRMGRQGTGIELDPDYFAIACRRVDEATRQPDLFIAPPSKPTQEVLF